MYAIVSSTVSNFSKGWFYYDHSIQVIPQTLSFAPESRSMLQRLSPLDGAYTRGFIILLSFRRQLLAAYWELVNLSPTIENFLAHCLCCGQPKSVTYPFDRPLLTPWLLLSHSSGAPGSSRPWSVILSPCSVMNDCKEALVVVLELNAFASLDSSCKM